MTVYIGIVTYNSLADLPACAAGVRAQDWQDIHVTVLDNHSADDSAGWVREHWPEALCLISGENLGYGRGHNRILESLSLQPGDFYLTLNPDAELAPTYVLKLVEALRSGNRLGWGTGKLLLKSSASAAARIYSAGHAMFRSGFAFNIGHNLPDSPLFCESREVFGAPGAAALYSAALIRDLSADGHFFDPAIFLYAEDTDVDWRAQRRGWSCWFAADAIAYHRGSSPHGALKIMAISNRYVSVLKNALLIDLLTFNLPYLLAHGIARVIVTPRAGAHFIASVARRFFYALRQREPLRDPALVRRLREWYRWSARQPSAQRSGIQRLWDHINRRDRQPPG
ncbi:MAG: glycosyltransferase [Anaerolineae bacterium]